MTRKATKRKLTDEEYYDSRRILKEISHEDIGLSLDDALRQDILGGKRKEKTEKCLHKNRPDFKEGEQSPRFLTMKLAIRVFLNFQ